MKECDVLEGQTYSDPGSILRIFVDSTTLPSPPLPPLPSSRPLPSHPLHSPPPTSDPFRSRPLKSSYGVWGSAVKKPNFGFLCILALKSDIWWQQF